MPYVPKFLPPGQEFGNWTVLNESLEHRFSSGRRVYRRALCRCKCGVEKLVWVFQLKDGSSRSCGCVRHVGRLRGFTRQQLEAERALRYKYGVDLKDRLAMAVAQSHCCAICGAPDKTESSAAATGKGRNILGRLVIDHDHETRAVRGLLCDKCNNGLGLFRDDPAILFKAAAYLARPQEGQDGSVRSREGSTGGEGVKCSLTGLDTGYRAPCRRASVRDLKEQSAGGPSMRVHRPMNYRVHFHAAESEWILAR